jgi:hypothetical protein
MVALATAGGTIMEKIVLMMGFNHCLTIAESNILIHYFYDSVPKMFNLERMHTIVFYCVFLERVHWHAFSETIDMHTIVFYCVFLERVHWHAFSETIDFGTRNPFQVFFQLLDSLCCYQMG